MEVAVLNIQGKETGRKVTLSDAVFGIEPNNHVVYLDVKRYLANKRQGTHKAKERNEVAGSTRKIKKQKGTGTARAGSVKSPVFVGGGRIFGPRPKDYTQKLTKNVKRLARRSALSAKAQSQSLVVLEDATKVLWKHGIYAENGMGCTGPIILVNKVNKDKAKEILRAEGLLS